MSGPPSQEVPGGGDALARERLAAVAYIASLIGHEARGRLATLRAALELLEAGMEANLSAEYRASLLHELDLFIGDFNIGLDMLRCDCTVLEPVSAHELVQEAVGMIEPLAARSGIRITPTFRHATDTIRTDRRLFRVTILNLLRNAVEALPGVAEPLIEIRVTGDAGWLQLEIADNGPGVPPGKREKLFLRLDKEGQAGSGFGLSICRDALLQLGGTVSEVSPPGGPGACFRVRIPTGT
jgi:signal transduction histidine kinase